MKTKLKTTMTLMMMLIMVVTLSTITSAAASKPKLSTTKLTIYEKGTRILILYEVSNSKVKWSSTNVKVATVTKAKIGAKITAKKKGTCYVKAKYKGKTYKCKVTVKKGTDDKWGLKNARKSNKEIASFYDYFRDKERAIMEVLEILNEVNDKYGASNGKIKKQYIDSNPAPVTQTPHIAYGIGKEYVVPHPFAIKDREGFKVYRRRHSVHELKVRIYDRNKSWVANKPSIPFTVTCTYPNFVKCSKEDTEKYYDLCAHKNDLVVYSPAYAKLLIGGDVPVGTTFKVYIEAVNGLTFDYTVVVKESEVEESNREWIERCKSQGYSEDDWYVQNGLEQCCS